MSNDFANRPGASPPRSGGGGGGRSGLPAGTDPKKWSARFPVYQIDFTALASGKRVASTKRRIRWRFGFSNRDALEAGETGTACRGEEHDVTIVWSVTSGKRLILADGQEVHYSTNRGGVLEYSWTMRGNHVLKVVAHAAPAMTATPGFRQYDLFIDGQSFFNMPKVYELGLKGPIPSHDRIPGVIDRAERTPTSRAPPSAGRYYDLSQGGYVGPEVPRSQQEEEEDLQRAISASIEESRRHLAKNIKQKRDKEAAAAPAPIPEEKAPAPAAGSDLLDFAGATPAPAPPASPPAPAPALPAPASYDQFSAPPVPPAAPAASYDQFATPPAYGAPPAAPPATVQPGALVPVAQQQSAGSYYAQQAAAPPTAPVEFAPQPQAPSPASTYDQIAAPAPAPAYDQFAAAPPPVPAADPFAPQPASDDPFAPKPPAPPTFSDVSSAIMGAYGTSDAGSTAGSVPISPSGASHPGSLTQLAAPIEGAAAFEPSADGAGPTTQFGQLNINTTLEEAEEEPKDDVDKLMKSLVNIDDISSPVENLSLNPFADDREKEEKEKKKREKSKRSHGIPPPAKNWVGAQPSLADMQQVKPVGEKKAAMANAFDPNAAHAGALVVHGSQNGGPPPLQQPTGFGVGATMSGGGYGVNASQPAFGASAPQQQLMQEPGYAQQPGYGAPPPQGHYQQQPPPPQQGYSNYQY